MKKLTLEQTEFAKEIGATHFFEGVYWKGGGLDAAHDRCPFGWDGKRGWVLDPNYYDVNHSTWKEYQIDFSDSCDTKHEDFRFAVEQLVEYCRNSSVLCDELDTVERMLKEM